MRLASLGFFLILISLHGSEQALSQPLSTFRDGPSRTWGFALFGLLTFIGLKWIWTLIRTQSITDLIGVAPALPLLGFVALTIRFHSFGLWQKTLIAYFVLLINMHELLRLCEHETKPLPRPGRIPVSELARQFYESGHYNPLQRSSDADSPPQQRDQT